MKKFLILNLFLSLPFSVAAQDVTDCASYSDSDARLACYDSAFPVKSLPMTTISTEDIEALNEIVYRNIPNKSYGAGKGSFFELRPLVLDCSLYIIQETFENIPFYDLDYDYRVSQIPMGAVSSFAISSFNGTSLEVETVRGKFVYSESFRSNSALDHRVAIATFGSPDGKDEFKFVELREGSWDFLKTSADKAEAKEILSRMFEVCKSGS